MELLFPRDEIGYGKECNNKNWATENHEYASCHICNNSGNQADKNHVGEGGEGGGGGNGEEQVIKSTNP